MIDRGVDGKVSLAGRGVRQNPAPPPRARVCFPDGFVFYIRRAVHNVE